MKMYVIVREDLGTIYKMVQGSHALAAYMLEHGQEAKKWNNETLIFLTVKNQEKLFNLKFKLETKNIEFSEFYEPDINNELTAITTCCEESFLKNYQLVK